MFPHSDLINADVLERLLGLHASGRLAHAYLFTGPASAGKAETAMAVAQGVNCQEPGGFKPGCRCASCRRIIDGNHPDIYLIEKMEDKGELLIEQVRGLIEHLSLRALEARVRTAIIKDADLLNTQASNAFLKTLEEPRPGTLLLLTSSVPGNILKTVLSRCHEVRFLPVENSVLVGASKSEYDVAALRNAIIDEFILGASSDALLKKWSADKQETRKLLDAVLMFYRDVLCAQRGAADQALCCKGRVTEVRRVAGKMSANEAQAVVAQAVKAVEAVNENFNVKLALTILRETIH